MVLWVVALLGLSVALASFVRVRRLARRLDQLNQSYWELRYDYTRLRAQVARLDPEPPADRAADTAPPAAAGASQVSFVPLASIRRKDQPPHGH
ncbi:MAG TPA: hypothetical protein VLD67_21100 [Vicinamibacterales bacterium]|nr:hypothetical protein [Vicinamibacterales bacterium]